LKEICIQEISFSLDPDPDSDADPNQDLIKMLHPDPDQSALSDQIGSRSETMLSTIQNDRDPALCGIARELFDEMFCVDPAA
jgi:hypothetical protein